jgi:hypothetical protein
MNIQSILLLILILLILVGIVVFRWKEHRRKHDSCETCDAEGCILKMIKKGHSHS